MPASRPASASQPALNRLIRVRLVESASTVLIDAEGIVDLVDADTGAVLGEACGGVGRAVFRAGGVRFPALGVTVPAATLALVPHARGRVGISRAGRSEWYPGTLRLVARSASAGAVVNVLDIEDYLPSVVAGELDRRFHIEAFRA